MPDATLEACVVMVWPATAILASATRRSEVEPPAADVAAVVMIWFRLAEDDATFVMASETRLRKRTWTSKRGR